VRNLWWVIKDSDRTNISLPRLCLEPQARCVLGDRPLDLVGRSVGKLRIDFKRYIESRIGVSGEKADDLLGYAHQVHFGGVGLDLNGAVKRFELR